MVLYGECNEPTQLRVNKKMIYGSDLRGNKMFVLAEAF